MAIRPVLNRKKMSEQEVGLFERQENMEGMNIRNEAKRERFKFWETRIWLGYLFLVVKEFSWSNQQEPQISSFAAVNAGMGTEGGGADIPECWDLHPGN